MNEVIEGDDAIATVIKVYLNGASGGDRPKLQRALHSDARMFGQAGGARVDRSMEPFFDI